LLDEPHIWTSVAKTAGLTLCVEHVIETAPGGTRLTERLQFSGPFAPLVSRLMARRLERSFTATTAHTARLTEGQ